MTALVLLGAGVGLGFAFLGSVALTASPQWVPRIAYLTAGAMFADRFQFPAFGTALRPYQFFVIILAFASLRAPRTTTSNPSAVISLLTVFTAFVTASLLWTISLRDTLVVAAGQSFLLLTAVTFASLARRGVITVQGALTAAWVGSTVTSAVALGQIVAAQAGSTWGIHNVVGIPWDRPAGLMTEPDWAGLAAAVGLIIGYLMPAETKWRRTALLICLLAVGFTGVRAIWVALAVLSLALVAARTGGGRLARRGLALGTIGASAIALTRTLSPNSLSRFSPSAILEARGDGGAINSRLGVIRLIRDRATEAIAHGNGAGTLAYETSLEANAQRYVGGGELNAGRGSTNLFATTLWDLGIPGLAIVLALVFAWLLSAHQVRRLHPALLPIALLLLIDFQVNNGLRFGFVWMFLGLTAAATVKSGATTGASSSGGPSAISAQLHRHGCHEKRDWRSSQVDPSTVTLSPRR